MADLRDRLSCGLKLGAHHADFAQPFSSGLGHLESECVIDGEHGALENAFPVSTRSTIGRSVRILSSIRALTHLARPRPLCSGSIPVFSCRAMVGSHGSKVITV